MLGPMVISISVNLWMINEKAKDTINGRTLRLTRENGVRIECMELER